MARNAQFLLDDRIQQRLYQIGDPVFMATDSCLNCSLPFDCDEFNKSCGYIKETGHKPDNGTQAVKLSDLTDEERKERIREQKREHMRRVRAEKRNLCTTA